MALPLQNMANMDSIDVNNEILRNIAYVCNKVVYILIRIYVFSFPYTFISLRNAKPMHYYKAAVLADIGWHFLVLWRTVTLKGAGRHCVHKGA